MDNSISEAEKSKHWTNQLPVALASYREPHADQLSSAYWRHRICDLVLEAKCAGASPYDVLRIDGHNDGRLQAIVASVFGMAIAPQSDASPQDTQSDKLCSTCGNWKRMVETRGTHKGEPKEEGECRLHAPKLVQWADQDGASSATEWPITNEKDWCGDHQIECSHQEK